LGVGVLGFGVLGMAPNPQSPIPNPQSPIANPQSKFENIKSLKNIIKLIYLKYNIINER